MTQPRILQRPRQDYQDREDNQVNEPRRGYQDPSRLFQQDERLFNPYDSRNDTMSAYHNAGPVQNFNQGHRNFHPSNRAPQNYSNNTNYARTRFNTAPRQAPSDFRPEPNFSNDYTLNSNVTRPSVPRSSQWHQRDQQQQTQSLLHTARREINPA